MPNKQKSNIDSFDASSINARLKHKQLSMRRSIDMLPKTALQHKTQNRQ